MTDKPSAVFLSAVGGGPISRIVDAIAARSNVDITTVNVFSTTDWKRVRGLGGIRFLAARLVLFLIYPFVAVLQAMRADVAITSTNPFWLPNVLLWTRKLHRSRVITLVYDVYPDSLTGNTDRFEWVRRLMHRLNRHWTHASSAVVYISGSMRDALTARYGTPSVAHIIVTGTDCSEFTDPPLQPDLAAWASGKVLISYVGNAGQAHDVDTLIEIVQELAATHRDEIAVLCAATGARATRLVDALRQLDVAHWSEPILQEDRWRWVQARTDIAAVTLSTETAIGSMPSKFFSALGAGSAVLTVAPQTTDLYKLTVRHRVGVATQPGETENVSDRLRDLIDDRPRLERTKARARQIALNQFDVATLAKDWEALIESSLG